jgi:Ser/Thr protein kinase RdoA (MazF antagonist)
VHRQAGAVLARLHAAGELTKTTRATAKASLQAAADGADKHLQRAGDRLSPAEQKTVRGFAEELRTVGRVPLGFIHGDAQLLH